ncbi:oligosaccharide flippase family protein [Halomarina ordinaria]|uniref:Polysaccharide biosynthesis C-terminal domain-containing protein n=1 Tax=Halomarina ordinaria TaxID=3033939 RepID=A0ABD5U931_9EURY|nr:polysaccharide biosynthesis C-terminal domain-containing protein [Halomarina sp. PSRA2]
MRIGQTSLVYFGSQFLTSILGFAVTLVLARELGASVLGQYYFVVSIVIWMKILSGQGIQTAAIKRISEGGDRSGYFGAVVLLQGAAFAVVSLVFLAGAKVARTYFDVGLGVSPGVVLGLLAASLFIWTATSALNGMDLVHLGALLSPIDRLFRSIAQVGVALAGLGTVQLLLAGYAVAEVLAGVVGIAMFTVRPTLPSREQVVSVVDYAKFSWFNGIESRAFASMDTIVLGIFVASDLLGIYEIAWNLASILAMFSVAISRSLFPQISRLSEAEGTRAVEGFVDDALAYSGLFVIPGLVGSLVLGESLMRIYGAEFAQGGLILVVLVFARLVYVYESQFTNTLGAVDRPDLAFRVNVVFIGLNLVLNVVLVYRFGWYGAAVATTLSAVAGLVLGYVYLSRLIEVPLPTREVSTQVGAALVMGVVVFAGSETMPGGIPATLTLVSVGAGVYFLALAALSRRFRATVRRNLPIP